MTKQYRSEQALDLLERFLKATEFGGAFSFHPADAPEAANKDRREEFINEVIGFITGVDRGEAPPEAIVESAVLILRDVRATLLETAKDYGCKNYSGAMLKVFKAGAGVSSLLGVMGVDEDKIETPPTKEEWAAARERKTNACNCMACRQRRLNGGAKSQ